MHIDISRSRFDRTKSYSGVLALQGRVTLDADYNELQDIWKHQVRTSLLDVIGQAGVPRDAAGFKVTRTDNTPEDLRNFAISAGRMYVDGILVENAADTTYWQQPFGHLDRDLDRFEPDNAYVVYLRVWEREVTVVQDDDLREVALGIHGPDTTARSQVVWQVAAWKSPEAAKDDALREFGNRLDALRAPRGLARARARTPDDADQDVCSLSPEAMYRGRENQLYRVEIFRGGKADDNEPAQFVWSRDNGSDVYAISRLAGAEVTVADLGRDARSALDVGDLVEVVDDGLVDRMGRDPGESVKRFLYEVEDVDTLRRRVRLDREPRADSGEVGFDAALHPMLRRWDSSPTDVQEGTWLSLEDGVEVEFAPAAAGQQAYRVADHWLAPARLPTGDVAWAQNANGPAYLPPDGVEYHYAALAFVPKANTPLGELRKTFKPLVG